MKPRVVSLVPSSTEIVCALERRELLVGRSQECDFPPEVRSLPVCVSTRVRADASSAAIDQQVKRLACDGSPLYEIDVTRLLALRPDIILTQAQCGVCALSAADVAAALSHFPEPHPKIIASDVARITGLWADIAGISDAIGARAEGQTLLSALKNRVVDVLQKTCAVNRRRSVACLDWLDPLMSAGHWMPELVDFAGGINLFGNPGQPSAGLTWRELIEKDPDVVVLMPCGFDLSRARQEAARLASHPDCGKLRAARSGAVFVADGNAYFNRPGPRLVDSLEILAEILWPKLFGTKHQNRGWSRLESVRA